jgi:hypothetical protein
MTPLQLRLLEAHYLAPNYTASAEEIALAADKTSQVTNAQYGRLGTKLRRVLHLPVTAEEQQSTIVVFFERPNETSPFWKLMMHPSLAKAIRELGWFGAEDVGTQPVNAQLDITSVMEGQRRRRFVVHQDREAAFAVPSCARFAEKSRDGFFAK